MSSREGRGGAIDEMIMAGDLCSGPPNAVPSISDGTDAAERPNRLEPAGDPIGLFYTWWRGDPLPALPHLPGLVTEATDDERLVADLMCVEVAAIRERIRQGQRPWLARMAGEPAGYGWVAEHEAAIGELGLTFPLPPGNLYLWEFMTLPAWRGHGIYPALLQAILRHERRAERFWIGHDLPNVASGRGIAKAGFQVIGVVYRLSSGVLTFMPSGPGPRAEAAAALLNLPLEGRLAQ